MTLHTPFSKPVATDPRTLEHAYVACGANLYYVLRSPREGLDEVLLEDCRTLKASVSTSERVISECRLVRAAP